MSGKTDEVKDFNTIALYCYIISGVLIALTVLLLYIFLDSQTISKVSWFRFSINISLLTVLWTFVMNFAIKNGEQPEVINPFMYAIIIMPINIYISHSNIGSILEATAKYKISILYILLLIIHVGACSILLSKLGSPLFTND